MITWFGPAVLLLLLAAAQPAQRAAGPGAVATVLAEEFAAVVTAPALATAAATRFVAAVELDAAPRVQPRCRSVRESGLPAPRAP